jgi:cyclopropane fatty-acyl-phospholipid synthase-like methyltransferase
MEEEIRRWFAEEGQRFLRKVGLRPGDVVLDFGCGRGCYTIPAAQVVGNGGLVYAVDRNKYILSELKREASSQNLTNIVPLRSFDEGEMVPGRQNLDVVLLFDVIHRYYFTGEQRDDLLAALTSKITPEGIVSIFPRHMSPAELESTRKQLRSLGFSLQTRMDAELLHDNRFTSGTVYTFDRSRTAARRVFTASSAQ